jgi:hypothetical protein
MGADRRARWLTSASKDQPPTTLSLFADFVFIRQRLTVSQLAQSVSDTDPCRFIPAFHFSSDAHPYSGLLLALPLLYHFKQEVQAQWSHNDFPLAIREVYHNELCELQTIVVDTSYEHISDLLEKEAFTDVMLRCPSFGLDMNRKQAVKDSVPSGKCQAH